MILVTKVTLTFQLQGTSFNGNCERDVISYTWNRCVWTGDCLHRENDAEYPYTLPGNVIIAKPSSSGSETL